MIIAYSYSEPLLESPPDSSIWGWEVEQIYQDLGGREQFKQLLEDCKLEKINYLLIRRVEELGAFVEEVSQNLSRLDELGICVITTEQDYNYFHSGNIQANLFKLLQEIQQKSKSRRIRQGHARNRIKAAPPPGKAPYGYRRGKNNYLIDRTQSPVIKEFFEQFILYGSLRGAVRYLEKKYNKKISVSTGHRWLTNPVYRGDTAYQNGEIISDTHTPIISQEEAAQIDRLLRRNRRLPPRTASAPRSLAGLVGCGECQSKMAIARVTSRNKLKEYLYLRPTACPKNPKCRAISYDLILEQTIERICQELPRAVAEMTIPNLEGIKSNLIKEIANKQNILSQLSNLVTTGILDSETAQLRTYKLKLEISKIESKLATLPPVNLREIAQTVSIPQFWQDLSESERRFYFREFIKKIEINRQERNWEIQLVFIF